MSKIDLPHLAFVPDPHGFPGVNENSKFAEKWKKNWSKDKPLHYGVYTRNTSLLSVAVTIFTGLNVLLLGTFGRRFSLLLKYPEMFTLKLCNMQYIYGREANVCKL